MNQIKTKNWKRISKRTARKHYSEGKDVYLLPCNFNPENVWQAPALMKKPQEEVYPIFTECDYFNKSVNTFENYNCGDKERGYYAAYYVRNED